MPLVAWTINAIEIPAIKSLEMPKPYKKAKFKAITKIIYHKTFIYSWIKYLEKW